MSVSQVTAGVLIGATVEALLPQQIEGASLTTQVFEVLVQVGMNGAALSVFAGLIRGEGVDPIYGIPFSYYVNLSQPELAKRIAVLSSEVKRRVQQVSQRMVQPALAA